MLDPLPLAVGALGGAVGTFAARGLARRLGFVNRPNPIVPQHTAPVAYLGGCGVAVGLVAAVLAAGAIPAWWPAAAAFLALGVLDDAVAMRAVGKLALQFAAAGLACAGGLVAPVTGIPAVDLAFSMLWIVLVVNAANLTDVCDGLVAGLGAIGLLALGALVPELGGLALGGAGACLGFLVFNRPPATIFLGDAGSHLVGFLLAALGLASLQSGPAWAGLPAAALVAGVPLFEFFFLLWVRLRKGLPWWRGSPDHFALRLQSAGLSRLATDSIAWSAALGLGAAAVLTRGSTVASWAALGVALLVALIGARALMPLEVSR